MPSTTTAPAPVETRPREFEVLSRKRTPGRSDVVRLRTLRPAATYTPRELRIAAGVTDRHFGGDVTPDAYDAHLVVVTLHND